MRRWRGSQESKLTTVVHPLSESSVESVMNLASLRVQSRVRLVRHHAVALSNRFPQSPPGIVARRGLHFSHVAVRVGRTARKPDNPRALHVEVPTSQTQELHIDSDEPARAADIEVEPITRIMLEFGMDPVTPPPPSSARARLLASG